MIRHDQYLQDIEVIEMMYRSLASILNNPPPKSLQWQAIFAEGPMDQINETLTEMHAHLKIPYPIPEGPLPRPADEVAAITDRLNFPLALEQLARTYRALGEMRKELHQHCPQLYLSLAQQFLPYLHARLSTMNAYLQWDTLQAKLAEMEKQFASADNGVDGNASPAPAPQLAEDQP